MSEKNAIDAAAPELSNYQCVANGGSATLTVEIKFILNPGESIDDTTVACWIYNGSSADSIVNIESSQSPRYERYRATFNSVDCDTTHKVIAEGYVSAKTPQASVDVDCPACDEGEGEGEGKE